VAAASIRRREATEEPQTGRSVRQKRFRPESSGRTDHPGRAVSERIHFVDGTATPPFQGGEIAVVIFNLPPFIHIIPERLIPTLHIFSAAPPTGDWIISIPCVFLADTTAKID